MKNFTDPLMRIFRESKPGQSLVEMALITPILLLMFLGVLEVGWALRGYLVLVNTNRETARYGVKNQVLDFSIKDPTTVGYNEVLSHTMVSLGYDLTDLQENPNLGLDFMNDPNGTLIMSHFVINTGLPCAKNATGSDPWPPYVFDPDNCDCSITDISDAQWYTDDDLVLHPDTPGYSYYAQTYGITQTNGTTVATRLNYQEESDKLVLENNQLNCTVLKTGNAGETSDNNLFVVETFYDQEQLVQAPLIANALTNPVSFYAHTAMRIVSSRDVESNDAIGPVCAPLPITFPTDLLDDPDNPTPNQAIDSFEGDGTGNFGWVNWDPDNNSNPYIIEELYNPLLAANDFEDALDPSDTSLNLYDYVSGSTGVNNSAGVQAGLEALVGSTVLLPVYDPDLTTGNGANKAYYIAHFARVTINKICLPSNQCGQDLGLNGSQKAIFATFLEYADDACE